MPVVSCTGGRATSQEPSRGRGRALDAWRSSVGQICSCSFVCCMHLRPRPRPVSPGHYGLYTTQQTLGRRVRRADRPRNERPAENLVRLDGRGPCVLPPGEGGAFGWAVSLALEGVLPSVSGSAGSSVMGRTEVDVKGIGTDERSHVLLPSGTEEEGPGRNSGPPGTVDRAGGDRREGRARSEGEVDRDTDKGFHSVQRFSLSCRSEGRREDPVDRRGPHRLSSETSVTF